MEILSPMQRKPHAHEKDEDGYEVDESSFTSYTEADVNPLMYPCGGTYQGLAHLDAEAGTREYIVWKVQNSASDGMCTVRLAEGANDDDLDVLYPLDGTGS